jgi:hypothetical protein
MDEFFKVWKEAKNKYGLSRIVSKSIFDGFQMKIYQDNRLIVNAFSDDEEEMYSDAAASLSTFVRIHEKINHASRSTRKENE